MIATATDVYEFAEFVAKRCRENGDNRIAQQLDDAMHLGSSGLEILGAIKTVLVSEATRLEQLVDEAKLHEAIAVVDSAYGVQ
jgi:hypothetical protein